MTRLFGDPATFVDESVAGFVDLYSHFVQPVPHGVIRSTATPQGKVAVIAGGGSGHYPAFAGYVGPGLADAAVCGNVFASPSTRWVYDVAKAVLEAQGFENRMLKAYIRDWPGEQREAEEGMA